MVTNLTHLSAAVIHYQPEKGNCSIIDPNAIYLCDSGAQYLDGTTDTTRTLHFGKPTEKEKRMYTLVLKGNIALDSAVFPKGVTGFALDCLARQFLWVGNPSLLHCHAADMIPAERRVGLPTWHWPWRWFFPQRTRRPHRYRHEKAILGSVHGCWKCDLDRAWLL